MGRYFEVQCPDNGSYWVDDESCLCSACGSKLRRDMWNPAFTMKKVRYDLSITYDGFYIASDRFRIFSDRLGLALSFLPLPAKPKYPAPFHLMESLDSVRIDTARSLPEFGRVCPACGQNTFIVGVVHCFAGEDVSPPAICHGDLQFGDGFEKFHILLVGEMLADALSRANFDGLHLSEVCEQ